MWSSDQTDRNGPSEHRAAQSDVRDQIWKFYRALKAYRRRPTKRGKAVLEARFDRIFTLNTGFVTLDRLLKRLGKNKAELLMVLDRPEIPLHTNGSENDIRAQVTRRKVSGGTRSDRGRDCRDAFLGLAKTYAKLSIQFWDYLGARLHVPNQPEIPYLPDIIKHAAPQAERPTVRAWVRSARSLSATPPRAARRIAPRAMPLLLLCGPSRWSSSMDSSPLSAALRCW